MGMTIKRLELRNFQAIKDFSADFTSSKGKMKSASPPY